MTQLLLTSSQWKEVLISMGILAGSFVLGRLLLLILDRVVIRILESTRTEFDNALLEALRLPVFLLSIFIGLQIGVQRLPFFPEEWVVYRNHSFFILYWMLAILASVRVVNRITAWYDQKMVEQTDSTLDEQVLPFARRVLLVLIGFIALILFLSHFEVNISAFVTTLGIGSLAVALAARATLEDTINGFVIMADRPFRIGDRIEILELDTWGDVKDVGLRSTRIRTRDNRMVVIPNSVIGTSLIVNHSIPSTVYRVETHVGVGYGTDIDQARQVMIDAVSSQGWVMKDRRIEALFVEWGDYAMIFRVRCWIENYVETRRILDKLNSCLYDALTDAGIDLPYPTYTVYHRMEEDQRKGFVRAFQSPPNSG
ncbi:MAG: mechanosensitive ion channel family protein [Anaerolineales bacterium]|nr:mechanosensitive ion channel family protein [Anaerolineales bacterium]